MKLVIRHHLSNSNNRTRTRTIPFYGRRDQLTKDKIIGLAEASAQLLLAEQLLYEKAGTEMTCATLSVKLITEETIL